MKIRFVLKEAFTGLTRNVTMTVAMIITTAISLALLATGVLITNMTADTKELYLDRIEVMVQLDDDISANDIDCSSDACAQLRDTLEADVVVVRFASDGSERKLMAGYAPITKRGA